jgi:hypothetical protein
MNEIVVMFYGSRGKLTLRLYCDIQAVPNINTPSNLGLRGFFQKENS